MWDFDEIRCPESHGEALESSRRAWDPLPRQNRSGFLEQRRSPYRLADLLVQAMDLTRVEQVESVATGFTWIGDRCSAHAIWSRQKLSGWLGRWKSGSQEGSV